MNNDRFYRLFRPLHYSLEIQIDNAGRHFDGTVTIEGETTGNEIRLHANELEIIDAKINNSNVEYVYIDNTVKLPTDGPGRNVVTLRFSGKVTDPMHGLYPCRFTLDGQPEELMATQFESHHAREVFPCVDEPEAKATFDLTLTTKPDITVLSNTPVLSQHQEGDKLVTTFETTPVMSTYLLAWVVGKLDYQQATTKDGVVVRAYATPQNKDKLRFSLESAVKLLEFFDDYFGVPYPLGKCDFVALPDFSAAAMENWGCITFRESFLLIDDTSATYTKQYAVMVIAHELAHQWFGNLVTMRWWNDLWLNESFANWIEYFATDKLYPQWQMWTQYYDTETTHAFDRDSLPSVQKIQQEVHEPNEINTLFDPAIVYAKGGSLLNMLHAYIGQDAFQQGLQTYLRRHQYSNTDASDLWRALSQASGKDVGHFMEPWITQAGFPVVTVGNGGRTVNLHQRRFIGNPKLSGGNDQSMWPVPLLSGTSLAENLLAQPSASLQLQGQGPILLNQGRTGYYICQYDSTHLQQLAQQVADGRMSVIDRMGLLSDTVYLAQAGLMSQVDALRLMESYRHETSEPVWGVMNTHFSTLKMFAASDEQQLAGLRRYIHSFAYPQYQRLGWEPIAGEPYFDELLRPQILAHMAYAEDQEVIDRMRQMFANATGPADIWADIRSTVIGVALKFGGEAEFEKVIEWYETASAEEHTQIIAAMSSLRDSALYTQALGLLTTDLVKLQDLIYWVIYLMRNRHATDAAWQWLQDNWQWIVTHYGNDMHYADFPKHAAGAFSTHQQLSSYKHFFGDKQDEAGLGRSIQQGIEDIEANMLWRERDGQAVAEFLKNI